MNVLSLDKESLIEKTESISFGTESNTGLFLHVVIEMPTNNTKKDNLIDLILLSFILK